MPLFAESQDQKCRTACGVAVDVPNVDQAVQHCACYLLYDWIRHDLRVNIRVAARQIQLQVQITIICRMTAATIRVAQHMHNHKDRKWWATVQSGFSAGPFWYPLN